MGAGGADYDIFGQTLPNQEGEGYDLGIRGFFFDLHLRPQYEQLDFDLVLNTKESVKKVRALAAETHRRCPQLGLFALAKIPLVVTWYRAGDPTPLYEEKLHCPEGTLPADRLAAAATPQRRKRATGKTKA